VRLRDAEDGAHDVALALYPLAAFRRTARPRRRRTLMAYVSGVRRSSRVAFGISWLVYAVVVVLAWRKVLAVPDGRGDINGLLVATLAGGLALALLGSWIRERERDG
jgi:hypothetical protein